MICIHITRASKQESKFSFLSKQYNYVLLKFIKSGKVYYTFLTECHAPI